MPPFVKQLLLRLLALPVTLLIITAALYGVIMLAPAEERAQLYIPPRTPPLTQEESQQLMDRLVAEHGLDDPYPVQYARWLSDLLRGDWGWSPTFKADVLTLLKKRLPVTAELTFYAVLVILPTALLGGVLSGWRAAGRFDRGYRLTTFVATSIPPFILGLFLLSIFYVGLGWFPPGRTGIYELSLSTSDFRAITGFLTFDGLLNGRLDVVADALRRLVLPVFTLSLLYWATVGRVTRVAMIEEQTKDYLLTARAKGLRERRLEWRHAFPNAAGPALTAMILSAAGLVTGVYIVESVFDFNGLSELITKGFFVAPDAPLVMGFAVFSVLLVLPIILLFDLLRVALDPRLREDGLEL
ncbi:MAG: ABC transporter permease [Candidatus Promineofilum sp.]|nr:ABC transporter permease [Promineifilum sp.]MCW5864973.1 ABC transporter permease [Anaerolineae bacterium]